MNILLFPFTWILSLFFESSINVGLSAGLSILVMSFCATATLIPLQKVIHYFEKINSSRKDAFRTVEEEIERCYKGHTKYLYLKTLYRQHNYNSLSNFIGLLVTLIQIPFFLAAYEYLSELAIFSGKSFLGIHNLAMPDGLILLGNAHINLLPVIMTLINLLNVEFVANKRSEKTMLQFMAFGFLIALYHMPSALVLYWTMNNSLQLLQSLLIKERRIKARESLKRILLIYKRFKMASLSQKILPTLLLFALYGIVLAAINPVKNSIGHKMAICFGLICGALTVISSFSFKFSDVTFKTFRKDNFYFCCVVFCVSVFPVFHYAYSNMVFVTGEYLAEIAFFLLLPSLISIFIVSLTLGRLSPDKFSETLLGAMILSFFLSPILFYYLKVRIEEGFIFQLILALLLTMLFLKIQSLNSRLFLAMVLCIFFVSFFKFFFRYIRKLRVNSTLTSIEIPKYFPNSIKNKSSVYFLIYDAYHDDAFMKYVGIDNSDQWNFLRSKGFKIYDRKLSLGNTSISSISTLYRADSPVRKNDSRKILVGNNPWDKFVKKNGYTTYYMGNDYFFKDSRDDAKGIILSPQTPMNSLLIGILQGEFKFDTISEGFNYDKWLNIKKEIFSNTDNSLKWIYAHSPYPKHTQNSGVCLPNEVELYKRRLDIANKEMRNDIEIILKNDPNSIIITAGDHGAYFLGDCTSMRNYNSNQIKGDHLIDRFGVHISIRWPSQDFAKYDDFDYLQGVFHSVLAFMNEDKNIIQHQPQGKICLQGVCASNDKPIDSGPDAGKMLFESLQ